MRVELLHDIYFYFGSVYILYVVAITSLPPDDMIIICFKVFVIWYSLSHAERLNHAVVRDDTCDTFDQ